MNRLPPVPTTKTNVLSRPRTRPSTPFVWFLAELTRLSVSKAALNIREAARSAGQAKLCGARATVFVFLEGFS
jgi:hypothetical protein